jgi:hypothetical protein
VCDLYLADGLYTLDSTQHSPLIGFAFDGFPIYGGYGYANADGTGGIVRMRSSYALRNISTRTELADGTDVPDGPPVGSTYPLGYFREDYAFTPQNEPYYLDEHNGRFCVTPEYPNGTYAYFCTVDEHWNSAYPYAIGPTYYGIVDGGTVTTVSESVTTYDPSAAVEEIPHVQDITVFPNPTADLIAVQVHGLLRADLPVMLYDAAGKLVRTATVPQGSTIWYLDTRTLYDGMYMVRFGQGQDSRSVNVQIVRH